MVQSLTKEQQLLNEEVRAVESSSVDQGGELLLSRLNGLVLHRNLEDMMVDGWPGEGGLVLQGLPLADNEASFRAELSPYLDRPLTLAGLEAIQSSIGQWFIRKGYPLVLVSAPAGQDISSGVIQLLVVRGRRGEVNIEGAQYTEVEWLQQQLRIGPGQAVQTQILKEDIQWLNRNPFRQVYASLQAGDSWGETDITLQVREQKPLRVFSRVENTGTEQTGEERLSLGVNMGGLWGRDELISYQYTGDIESRYLQAHSLNYSMPLARHHSISVSASYTDSSPISSTDLKSSGNSRQFGLSYQIPLPLLSATVMGVDVNLQQEWGLAYQYKYSNNNLSFGGLEVFDNFTEISQWEVNYQASVDDKFGSSSVSAKVVYSPGDASNKNSDNNFNLVRQGASSRYHYAQIYFQRGTSLSKTFTWQAEGQVQLASDNLLPSEQLAAGGYRTVRGYDEYQALADQGFTLRNELHFNGFKLGQGLGQLTLLGFFDYASLANKNRIEKEKASNLFSVGIGLHYSLSHSIRLRADYGWQLMAIADEGKDSRLHLGLEFVF